jgi:hypothetical protein
MGEVCPSLAAKARLSRRSRRAFIPDQARFAGEGAILTISSIMVCIANMQCPGFSKHPPRWTRPLAIGPGGCAPSQPTSLQWVLKEQKRLPFPTDTYGPLCKNDKLPTAALTQASVAERPVALPPVTREQRHANQPIP